jgi:hypothetical protein
MKQDTTDFSRWYFNVNATQGTHMVGHHRLQPVVLQLQS